MTFREPHMDNGRDPDPDPREPMSDGVPAEGSSEKWYDKIIRERMEAKQREAKGKKDTGNKQKPSTRQKTSASTEILTAALDYAKRNIPVFPCDPATKKPLVENGFYAATIDLVTIKDWWRQFPRAMIGIPTGSASQIFVVDADVDSERGNGHDTLKKLGFDQLDSRAAVTPRGGTHFYFRHQEGLRNTVGDAIHGIGPAVDTRGEGGYVIAPPSMCADGRRYEWLEDGATTIGPVPQAILDALKRVRKIDDPSKSVARAGSTKSVNRMNAAYARAAKDRECGEVEKAPVGSRNHTLNQAAFSLGQLVGAGLSENEIREALFKAAEKCELVKTDGALSVRKTIESGLRAGIKDPRKIPEGKPPKPKGNGGKLPSGDLPAELHDSERIEVTAPEWPDTDRKKLPTATCANARRAIQSLGIQCRYDVFHDRKLVGGYPIEQWAGEWSDAVCLMLRRFIRDEFGFDPGRDHANDAAVQLCLENQFDPVCDYLDGIEWDGIPRLETWLKEYLGARNTPFVRAVGRLMLIAAVRRARQPGCKFDEIPVFEGAEGTGKSTAISIMAGRENFSDQTILGLDDRQQQEAIRGAWLYEIADLAGMSKADVERTKAFASRSSDRARPAYGRHRVDQPRRGIFIGTTNDDTYLKSQTGNRRFWPVRTGLIDCEALRRDRDQLWAEAAYLEASGASLTLPKDLWKDAAAEQDKRRDHDPWDDLLRDARGTIVTTKDGRAEERIASIDLLTRPEFLNLPRDKVNDVATKRLAFCMQRLGWTKPDKAIRIVRGQKPVRGYVRPPQNRDDDEDDEL
jgi:predicted P-loop ATPase